MGIFVWRGLKINAHIHLKLILKLISIHSTQVAEMVGRLKASLEGCGFWETEWMPSESFFLWNGWPEDVRLWELEPDKVTRESCFPHKLSKVKLGPLPLPPEWNEDGGVYCIGLSNIMYWKTKNEARHVGGGQQLAVIMAVKITQPILSSSLGLFFKSISIRFLGIRSPRFKLCSVSGVDLMACE